MYREEHIHTSTRTHTDVWKKKTVIRSRSHWAVHSHKFSNHKTTIFVVLDRYCFFVAFLPLNISLMRLLLLLGWFCSDHHSLQVRFRWYYVNISGWHTYIYWAPPSSFYNALQTNKKKNGEMLGCFENISSHQRTNNNKKIAEPHPKNPYTYIHSTDQKKERRSMCRVWKEKKNRSETRSNLAAKQNASICENYVTIKRYVVPTERAKNLNEKKKTNLTHTHITPGCIKSNEKILWMRSCLIQCGCCCCCCC